MRLQGRKTTSVTQIRAPVGKTCCNSSARFLLLFGQSVASRKLFRHIFEPLGMHDTRFRPSAKLRDRIAPTEKRRGQMNYLGDTGANAGPEGDQWLRGEVHDPTSYRMGAVAGHAGLFSTADDLAVYCQMILNGGQYRGARILSPLSVAEMTPASTSALY